MHTITKDEVLQFVAHASKDIVNLNCGGCGVFAYVAGSVLNKFHNCEARFKVVTWGEKSKNTDIHTLVPKKDKHNIDSWYNNGMSFPHILIEVNLKGEKPFIIDSDGLSEMTTYKGSVPIRHLRGLVRKPKGWNDDFRRSQTSKIMININDYFKKHPIRKHTRKLSTYGWDLKPIHYAWSQYNE